MRRWLVVLALLLGVTVPCSQAWAAGGHENELENPCFENGGASWEVVGPVQFGPMDDRAHVAWDPQGELGESSYLRQVVDDSLFNGWDPLLNHKVGELSFWLKTTGDAYVQVGFDWWDRMTLPKPGPGDTVGYHYVVLDRHYQSLNQWTQVVVPYDWVNVQPRWVSIEIYYFACIGVNYAAVDTTEFWGKCVPEPSSLIALFGGLVSAGLVLRRRR